MGENFSSEKSLGEPQPPNYGKPRGTVHLLGDALRVYRSKFPSFLAVMGIPVSFALVVSELLYFLFHTNFVYSPLYPILHFLSLVISFILFLLSSIALLLNFKQNISPFNAYRKSWKFLLSFLWLFLLSAGVILGGLLLGLIPGILFATWFSLALPVFVFEGRKGFSVLLRSKQLIEGNFWKTLGRLLLIALIWSIATSIVYLVLSWKIDYIPLSNLVGLVGSVVIQLLLLPLFILYLSQIYEELSRIKAREPLKAPSPIAELTYYIPTVIGMTVLVLTMGFFSLGILRERDIPPINDSDLVLPKIHIPKEQNAYYELMTALDCKFPPKNGVNVQFWNALFDDMLAGRRLLTEEASQLMAKNKELYKHIEIALQRPYLQAPDVEDPRNFTTATSFSIFSRIREIARWGVVRANYLWARGNEREAMEWLLRVVKLGDMLENSPRPMGLFNYITAKAIKDMGIRPMLKLIRQSDLPPQQLVRFARELEKMERYRGSLERTLKMEYALNSNDISSIERVRLWRSAQKEPVWISMTNGYFPFLPFFVSSFTRFLFKPNETRLQLAQPYRSLIGNLDKTYKEAVGDKWSEKRPKEAEEIFIKSIFKDNPLGKMMIEIPSEDFPPVFVQKCIDRFYIEGASCLFALRAYYREKGELPQSLKELVPRYLSSLPIDPFDGEPLRYSRELGIIYCVGKDLKDSGGSPTKIYQAGQVREAFWTDMSDPTIDIGF
jgi:hypothetical protein